MAQYEVEIQYPPSYPARDRTKAVEMQAVVVYADWADDAAEDNTFTVDVVSDDKRFKIDWDLTDQLKRTVLSNLATVGEYSRRHFAELTARVGFWGSYFSLGVTKKVPTDGVFKWFGFRYKAFLRGALEAENEYSGSDRQDAW